MRVVTNHILPPIPDRRFDWCAYYEGEEEAGLYGYGATEAEAIADFNENYRDMHDERLGIASCPQHTRARNGMERMMSRQAILDELHARLDASKRVDAASDLITAKVYGEVSGQNRHLNHVPSIKCADGFKMSVQASAAHYCSPRDSDGPWKSVEVGYPSARVEAFMPFIAGGEDTDPTATVYGYVPLAVVADAIADHGGFAPEAA